MIPMAYFKSSHRPWPVSCAPTACRRDQTLMISRLGEVAGGLAARLAASGGAEF